MVKHGYPLSRRTSYRETTVSRRQIVEISSHLPGQCVSDPIGRGRPASSSATKVNSAAVTLTRLPRPCRNTQTSTHKVIEVRPMRRGSVQQHTTSPTLTGRRNQTLLTAAVA